MSPDDGPLLYYGEHEPLPALRAHVAACWCFRVRDGTAPLEHTVPPDGSVSLWCGPGAPGLGATGPHTRPLRVEVRGGDRLWGVRFWPGAVGSLLPIDPSGLREQRRFPGELALGRWEDDLCARLAPVSSEGEAAELWSEALMDRLAAAAPLDNAAMTAVFAILASSGTASIREVAKRVGLSPRQLRRRFRTAVGLSPKELSRVRRVRASLIGAVDGSREPWVELAAMFGYADQAHLIREYRRVVGLSPQALLDYLGGITHGRLLDR